jgi:hypothetical protein
MAPNAGKVPPHNADHLFVIACIRQGCGALIEAEKVGFDDEFAWAFCEFCAFLVAAERRGVGEVYAGKTVLLPHNRATGTGGGSTAKCRGGDTVATLQPGPEAKSVLTWYSLEAEDDDDDEDDTDSSGGD